jgi:exopolysaccharide biosynthesis predicted pyruvyltransferase EpsI
VNDDDIIIINGGGYFGLYDRIIKEQVTIVKNFPNNQIIFFPCSIFDNPKKKKKNIPHS